ncbi:DUF3593 domain-containing [Olea europaea subsp. europaea]|uniref:DUF3593 domain-containing, partial n=1 Tax=Olea europaea subsp. europaea TaxID=158383 RepID=A0A8S0QEK3_OLEEU|nr:DUF3593 domain-containing [Olea europaea subsp. europaea]
MISSMQIQSLFKNPKFMRFSSSYLLPNCFNFHRNPCSRKTYIFPQRQFKYCTDTEIEYERRRIHRKGKGFLCNGFILPVDPWAPNIDSESIASQLFAFSLFPYLGFLYFITKSKSAPKLTLFGFYFLLAFVGATTKVHYGTSLSNVDWLHGGAESLLTLTNLFIVLGLREALRKVKKEEENESKTASGIEGEEKSSI